MLCDGKNSFLFDEVFKACGSTCEPSILHWLGLIHKVSYIPSSCVFLWVHCFLPSDEKYFSPANLQILTCRYLASASLGHSADLQRTHRSSYQQPDASVYSSDLGGVDSPPSHHFERPLDLEPICKIQALRPGLHQGCDFVFTVL